MIETRYAILSMILLSFLTLQYKNIASNERLDLMRSEIQFVASGTGTDHLDEVGTLEFRDIADLGGEHQSVDVALDADTLSFDLTTMVSYVERDGQTFATTADSTNYLRVTVTIDGPIDGSVSMSRIYSRASS